jgi:hypothetical protein
LTRIGRIKYSDPQETQSGTDDENQSNSYQIPTRGDVEPLNLNRSGKNEVNR